MFAWQQRDVTNVQCTAKQTHMSSKYVAIYQRRQKIYNIYIEEVEGVRMYILFSGPKLSLV